MSIRFRTLFEVPSLIGQGIVERRSRARAAQDYLWIWMEDFANLSDLATGSYGTWTSRKLEGKQSHRSIDKRGTKHWKHVTIFKSIAFD